MLRDFYKQLLLLTAVSLVIWFLSYILAGANPIGLLAALLGDPTPSGVLGNVNTSSIPQSLQLFLIYVFLAIPGILQLVATFLLTRALVKEKVPWATGIGWVGLFCFYNYGLVIFYAKPLGEAGLAFFLHFLYWITATLFIGIVYSILKLRDSALSAQK